VGELLMVLYLSLRGKNSEVVGAEEIGRRRNWMLEKVS
jgi:hypothetical protein